MPFKRNLISIIIFLAGFLVFSYGQDAGFGVSRSPSGFPSPKTFTITGVGDMMFGTSFPSARYLPPNDNPMLLVGSLADTLRSSDVTFGNLEGSFLDSGEPFKKCRDTNICYLFRMPERYASVLKHCGFDFISLANNHFGDFGWQAALRTEELLDSLGISFAGSPESNFSIIEKDSVKFGFCSFSPTAGAIDINDMQKTESIVSLLEEKCDVVIVSFHGGAEGSNYQRVLRADEIFYGENRGDVYKFAHRMVDCGADIIFGHGPHITRAVELYKGRLICYSLGNFCTYGRFNISGPNGIAPIIRLKTDKDGLFISGQIIPVFQDAGGVRFDPLGRVISKIRELTAIDFPETEVTITPEGYIFNKK